MEALVPIAFLVEDLFLHPLDFPLQVLEGLSQVFPGPRVAFAPVVFPLFRFLVGGSVPWLQGEKQGYQCVDDDTGKNAGDDDRYRDDRTEYVDRQVPPVGNALAYTEQFSPP